MRGLSCWKYCHSSFEDVVGIVVWDLNGREVLPDVGINLDIGHRVRIEQECDDWYYGWSLEQKVHGIFPKSAVRLKAARWEADVNGEHVVFAKESPVAQEIFTTLKEWQPIARDLFLEGSSTFEGVLKLTYELGEIRKQILSESLPNDEVRKLNNQAVQKLDLGNRLLKLDVVLRDEDGAPLRLDLSNLVETYRLFKAGPRVIAPTVKETASQIYSLPAFLMLNIQEISFKIPSPAELIVGLFNDEDQKFLSENIRLDCQHNNELAFGGRVCFADLKAAANPKTVFLVCQIIRKGPLENRDVVDIKKISSQTVRRPVAVAAVEVTKLVKLLEINDGTLKTSLTAPVVLCGESESMQSALKRALVSRSLDATAARTGQGWLTVTGKLFQGGIKQVREEHPHYFIGNPPISRILGYPKVPVPGDVRNDIYITLERGELKSVGRNVEVCVCVCDEKGNVVPKAVCAGVGAEPVDVHTSIVYYHDEKPKWWEMFKVNVGFEQFATSHIRFVFKQRSSNETKDKVDKALAYLPLKSEDGTALADNTYRLAVYKFESKKSVDDNGSISPAYLNLPHEYIVENIQTSQVSLTKTPQQLPASGCFVYSLKDTFLVSSLLCSTKLTQNATLLGLLKWKSNPMTIEQNLRFIQQLKEEEVIRFLQDILDVLFDISSMTQLEPDKLEPPSYVDKLVLEVLVYLIDLVIKHFASFRPILDSYIEENFCAALAYQKLMHCLRDLFVNLETDEDPKRRYFNRCCKTLEYLFRFIVRSRILYARLNSNQGEAAFKENMTKLLQAIADTLSHHQQTESFRTAGGHILKYVPSIIPELLKVVDSSVITSFYAQLILSIPEGQHFPQQVESLAAVIQGPLFQIPACRTKLMRCFCELIQNLLASKRDIKGCCSALSEMVRALSVSMNVSHHDDLSILVEFLLEEIVQTVIDQSGNGLSSSMTEEFLVILLDVLRLMTSQHYDIFINKFDKREDLRDFLFSIFLSFRSFFTKCAFNPEWADMIMLQNSVMLEALAQLSLTIRSKFVDPFEKQLWGNFFECAVAFCTQDSLQLEKFSENKRRRILRRYGDMRLKICREIRAMWNSLGAHKRLFIPDLLASLLDMSLIPVTEVRQETIIMFVDMMQCEFRLPKSYANGDGPMLVHGRLAAFEDAMIKNLDHYIEGGRGDVDYVDLFDELMTKWCANNVEMGEKGLNLVRRLVEQMRLLLEYRSVMVNAEVDIESKMCCTVNLLEYYEKICKREMYIRYLYKLRDLHLDLQNYTEVAFTLELHARLLLWTDETLPAHLRSPEFPTCETHRELKEKLAYQMIEYFDKGKAWEYAINRETGIFKELQTLYETDTYEYSKLSSLLRRMADFYDKIISPQETRVPCEYFRVAYWGKGFPAFWQNKAFVFRGKECDNIRDFTERMLGRFPGCNSLKTMDPPSMEIVESDNMYMQIWKVDPDKNRSVHQLDDRFGGKPVSQRIRSFYLSNEISSFTYHRRLNSSAKGDDVSQLWLERTVLTVRSSLPGILSWSQIMGAMTEKVSPIQSAIETVQCKNDDIYRLVEKHLENPAADFDQQAASLLGGVLDPAVNGGITNYEKAFFSPDFISSRNTPDDLEQRATLKDLIASQIPLLDTALEIYGQKVNDRMRPFYEHITGCFRKQKAHVETNYGVRPSPFPKLTLKRPPQTHLTSRSVSTIERPKNSSVFYTPPKENGSLTSSPLLSSSYASVYIPKRVTNRATSLSSLSLRNSSGRESTVPSVTNPIELNQSLTPIRKPRTEERRNSRPQSGSFKARLSVTEEDPAPASPGIPPPLPEKKHVGESLFATTPRRPKSDKLSLPPEKPPLPDGDIPVLPAKRRSASPKVLLEGSSPEPPPIPAKQSSHFGS